MLAPVFVTVLAPSMPNWAAVPSGTGDAACIDAGNTSIESNSIDINRSGRMTGDKHFLSVLTRLANGFSITNSPPPGKRGQNPSSKGRYPAESSSNSIPTICFLNFR
jgi:hypothetical protein